MKQMLSYKTVINYELSSIAFYIFVFYFGLASSNRLNNEVISVLKTFWSIFKIRESTNMAWRVAA